MNPPEAEWNPGSTSQASDLCRRTCVCDGERNVLSINSKYLKKESSAQLSIGTLGKNSSMSANNELFMSM